MKSNIHIGEDLGAVFDKTAKPTIDFIRRVKYNALYGIVLPRYSEMLDKIYEPYPEFLPTENDVVYDIGAQYGDYALICYKKYHVKKVYAFEPLYKNYREMDILFKMHHITYDNIETHGIALSDKNEYKLVSHDGMLKLEDKGSLLEYVDFKGLLVEYVDFKVLDEIASNFIPPTILKIDVERYERKTLDGARNTIEKTHPKIIMETHTKELKESVIDFLTDLNYSKPKSSCKRINKDGNEYENLFFMPIKGD